jgi:hypothetical protein
MKHVPISCGTVFGRLIVVSRKELSIFYICQCECGNTTEVRAAELRSGGVRSCGCLKHDSLVKRHKETNPDGDSRYILLSTYRYGAKKRGLAFTIPKDVFYSNVQQPCTFCGSCCTSVVNNRYGNYPFHYTGLDRIDSSLGYTEGNVQPCCKICNKMKSNYTEEMFLHHVAKVYKKSKEPEWNIAKSADKL